MKTKGSPIAKDPVRAAQLKEEKRVMMRRRWADPAHRAKHEARQRGRKNTPETIALMSASQAAAHARKVPTGICEICGEFKALCQDHNHVTGALRGKICNNCNTVLGFMRDNPVFLRSAADYLERWS